MSHDLASMVFATTARVSARATDSAALLVLAEQRADPAIFETNEPFFWPNEISSNRLDAYFTRMDPLTTLPNFAADAAEGRAFLAGHNSYVLPFGATLTGMVETIGEVTRVLADAYTLSGLTLGGVNVDSFIAGVRAGIIRDVSVGFYGGQWICGICGRDMLADWYDCWHVPGLVYETKDADMGQTVVRELLCTALIKNAHLAEVSAVYDGATPGAAILQAQRAAESGRLSPMQAQLLEQRYRINLPGKRISAPGADLPKERSVENPENTPAVPAEPAAEVVEVPPVVEPIDQPVVEETPVAEEPAIEPAAAVPAAESAVSEAPQERRLIVADDITWEGIRSTQIAAGSINSDAVVLSALRSMLGLAADADVAAHVRQIATQAEDGRTYRAQLIDEAIAEGVRAMGTDFTESTYRSLLEAAPIATIKQLGADWTKQAEKRFVGGRVSLDTAAVPQDAAPAIRIPDAAYAG